MIIDFITWGARSDQSESWIAVEYILYSTVTRSETAVCEGVELNCNIEGGGASDTGAVGRGALATCSPKSMIGRMLPSHSLPSPRWIQP